MLLSNVTAPFRARDRPVNAALLFSVMDCCARMVPSNSEPVPSVAEVPTCQKMLLACAPLIKFTLLPDAVMSVVPI